jgi:methylated-DNA-[protein]-cysteine S-methyltransferase
MKITSNHLPAVRDWLLKSDFVSILDLAGRQKRILSLLTALTYDPDPRVTDRAIEATGRAAPKIAQRDPEFVRNYILRLFWLVNDESGGICWRAPELIGAIIHACPQFAHFNSMLVSLLDLEKEDAPRFRDSTLRAIEMIRETPGDDDEGWSPF